ncbi:MAG TPA: hypothetical protein VJZ27_04095 [Aggregatilineales bacterium]|nr:hypothetical protein [Aggregatilineales bacterium]
MIQRITTFFTGVFCGAAAGAIVALILTPDSGQKLRQRSRQHFQQILLESARAAQIRREELRTQLGSKTSLPDEK